MLEKNMEDPSITNVVMDDVGEMGILGLVFRRSFGHVIKHKTSTIKNTISTIRTIKLANKDKTIII